MAEFVKTFKNNVTENKLIFRGKKLALTMIPCATGSKIKEVSLSTQLLRLFPEDTHIEEIAEIADTLWYEDDDRVIHASLEELEQYE